GALARHRGAKGRTISVRAVVHTGELVATRIGDARARTAWLNRAGRLAGKDATTLGIGEGDRALRHRGIHTAGLSCRIAEGPTVWHPTARSGGSIAPSASTSVSATTATASDPKDRGDSCDQHTYAHQALLKSPGEKALFLTTVRAPLSSKLPKKMEVDCDG